MDQFTRKEGENGGGGTFIVDLQGRALITEGQGRRLCIAKVDVRRVMIEGSVVVI